MAAAIALGGDHLRRRGIGKREGLRRVRIACAQAVIDAAKEVEALGGSTTLLPVDENGVIEQASAQTAVAAGAAVLSAMWVNNEVGVIQDVAALATACSDTDTLFHTDAVQAIGKVPCTVDMVPGYATQKERKR